MPTPDDLVRLHGSMVAHRKMATAVYDDYDDLDEDASTYTDTPILAWIFRPKMGRRVMDEGRVDVGRYSITVLSTLDIQSNRDGVPDRIQIVAGGGWYVVVDVRNATHPIVQFSKQTCDLVLASNRDDLQFRDDFSTLDLSKWTVWGGNIYVSDGILYLQKDVDDAAMSTPQQYDLGTLKARIDFDFPAIRESQGLYLLNMDGPAEGMAFIKLSGGNHCGIVTWHEGSTEGTSFVLPSGFKDVVFLVDNPKSPTKIECWIDGTKYATHTTHIPNPTLKYYIYLLGCCEISPLTQFDSMELEG